MVSAPDFHSYELKGVNVPPVYVRPVQYTVAEEKLPPHSPPFTLVYVASSVTLAEFQAAPEAGGVRAEQMLMAPSLS